MLTDYHLHLRPDEAETTFDRYFTAANADRYRAAADAAGIGELGVSEHVYRFRQALDLWSHPLWTENGKDDLDEYCEFVRSTSLRLGVECDYVPGAEERTAAMLEARDFDYVVGSVHFIGEGDAAVDHDGFDVWEAADASAEEIWTRYFEHFDRCARSGLFDILAHPDLVKVWGRNRPLPEGDLRCFYEPAVEAIVAGGSAVELLHRGPAQAGRRAVPGARLRRAPGRGRGAVRALLRCPSARAGRLRLRPRARLPRRDRGGGDRRLREAPTAARAARRAGRLRRRWSGSATTAIASPRVAR